MKKAIFPCVLALGASLLAGPAAQAQGYTLTTLISFNGTNGGSPVAGLTLSGNTLYGTAAGGGAYSDGIVFSVPVSGGPFTTLAGFNGTNGNGPQAGLTVSGGTIYGTTQIGGANNAGTVFSLPTGGGSVTTLASFNGPSAQNCYASVTLSGGYFYGTTYNEGPNGVGTVFSVPVGGGPVTTLAAFNGTNGQDPIGPVTVSADGKTVYGTTGLGGANNAGTVFSLPTGGGSVTTLASFNFLTNGSMPNSGLILSADGKTLYGTAEFGGASNDGTVFSVPVGGGSITALATFTGANGADLIGGLTMSADGKTLYGTAEAGGASNDGTVFSVPVGGGSITTLATFTGANGLNPFAGLTLGADGKTLYGTTIGGGASGRGTVFALTPNAAPEPSQAAALGLGILGLTGLTLKARRRSAKDA